MLDQPGTSRKSACRYPLERVSVSAAPTLPSTAQRPQREAVWTRTGPSSSGAGSANARHHPAHRAPRAGEGCALRRHPRRHLHQQGGGRDEGAHGGTVAGHAPAQLGLYLPQPLRPPAAARGGGRRPQPRLRDLRRRRPGPGGARGPQGARPPREVSTPRGAALPDLGAQNSGRAAAEDDGDSVAAQTLARVSDRYHETLRAANALDFDDLLLRTASMLAGDETVRESYRRRFATCSSTSTRTRTAPNTSSSATFRDRTAT